MARYKSPNRNYKSFWSYLTDWLGATLLFGIFITIIKIMDLDWIIYDQEVNAYLFVVVSFLFAAKIWQRLYFGTVNGRVVIDKSNVLLKEVQDIEISLRALEYKVEVGTVSKNAKGEYLFQCKVPLRHKFTLGIDVGNIRVLTEDVGEIEGVRWLFGMPKFGLPISSGEPVQVDVVVSDISQNTIATHSPKRKTSDYRSIPMAIFGIAVIYISFGTSLEIWSRFFEGTIYGQVIREDGDTNRLEDIEVSLNIEGDSFRRIPKKWRPVLTNAKGEYRLDNCVSVNDSTIRLTVKYETETPGYYREIHNLVEGIEGVRRFLGLPISSGIPKRVDFVIPDIPPPIIGN